MTKTKEERDELVVAQAWPWCSWDHFIARSPCDGGVSCHIQYSVPTLQIERNPIMIGEMIAMCLSQ